ncbi:MAG TPA: nicotinate-nucleotide adenylyltransferase [Candidatus Bathyarchaeia archaeon]|nr:nicotinate-nucleotide adenylyltransferase [Candidatus Bathyarchaeia archaeon]
MAAERERIGLFGGSFDPVHTGHLILAQAAVNVAGLARVLFLPTASPPHKRPGSLTDIETRARMVTLAIAGNPRFELSRIEVSRGVSYTYRTVRSFVEQGYGKEEIHLIIGSDSLEEIDQWRNPGEIFSHATILVMQRPGHERLPALPPEAAVIVMTAGATAISARAIRALAAEGRSIRYLVPDAVERFIAAHSLYGAKA